MWAWPGTHAPESIGTAAGKETGCREEGGDGGVSEKSLENEEVPGFPVPGRGRTGPFVVQPKSLGMEGMNKTAPTEVVGHILDAGQDAKTEILVETCAVDFLSEIWFSVVTFCHSAAEQRAGRSERQ
jgi:hypothetical protein